VRRSDAVVPRDVVDLPEIGIKGNSHFPLMDKNNLEVADLIQKWLSERAYTRSQTPSICRSNRNRPAAVAAVLFRKTLLRH
jgi:hypothetical protein